MTRVTQLTGEVLLKRLELARELVPTATVIALLINPANPTAGTLTSVSRDGNSPGYAAQVLEASTEAELNVAFAALLQKRAGALVIAADAFFNSYAELLAALAISHSVLRSTSFASSQPHLVNWPENKFI